MFRNRVHDSAVICSERFNQLSLSTQVLYTKCIAYADDYGIVEVHSILRATPNLRRTSVNELKESGLVTVLHDSRKGGLIVYINEFHKVNSFSKYGAKTSVYYGYLEPYADIKKTVDGLRHKEDTINVKAKSLFDIYIDLVVGTAFERDYPEACSALADYYAYLDEVGGSHMTKKSIVAMISTCQSKCNEYGDEIVTTYIKDGIANGWKSLNWNLLDKHV